MTKAVPALLVLLLVCALPAMSVVAAAPSQPPDRAALQGPMPYESSPVDDGSSPVGSSTVGSDAPLATVAVPPARMLDGASSNTTNRLGLDGPGTQAYVTPSPDFGTAVGSVDDDLQADFELSRTERAWDGYTRQERREVLDRTFDRIDERIEVLEQREREVVAAHAAGEASAARLVRTLVRTDQESRTLVEHLQRLDSLASEVPGYSIDVRSEQAILETHQSSLRAAVATTFDGFPHVRESNAVHVQSTETGTVVSMIDGDRYFREAIRFDNRDLDAPDSLGSDTSAVEDRRAELYPWATGDGDAGSSGIQIRADRQLYPIDVRTTQGFLRAYIDGGTEDVFSEKQELRLADLPSAPMDRSWSNESLELSVNRTPVNGPIEVTLTDREANEPVDGTVRIDGYRLGETGADGSLWVAPPAGEYELSVRTDERTVNATIGPN